MELTLNGSDELLVDSGDSQSQLRDGVSMLRTDDALNVKRVDIERRGRLISVLSDNPAYPSWRSLERRAIEIVGRVLWFGRKLQ